ncbi:MAG: hypothetical protein QXY49_00240 [Thermofilaceae archaeon]
MRVKNLLAHGVLGVALVAIALALRVNVSTDSPVYKPGDIIIITIEGEANTTYDVRVFSPNDSIIFSENVTTNENGISTLTLELPAEAPSGTYIITVLDGGERATVTFTVEAPLSQEPEITAPRLQKIKGADKLVEAAARLKEMVYCRNQVLANYNLTTYANLSEAFNLALNLTLTGDSYLSQALAALEGGNYSTAKSYAVLALQKYGKVIELQEELRDRLDASFAACRAVLAEHPPVESNETYVPRNLTCKWTPEFYPVKMAFDEAERRLAELESIVANLTGKGYNLTAIADALIKGRGLVEEGRARAASCNISAAAHYLAQVRSILGHTTAQLAKLGRERLVKELRNSDLDINETEVGEALRRGKLTEKLVEKINRTLERIELISNESLIKLTNLIDKISKTIDKQYLARERERIKISGKELERERERIQNELKKLQNIQREIERIRENLQKSAEAKRGKTKEPPGKGSSGK